MELMNFVLNSKLNSNLEKLKSFEITLNMKQILKPTFTHRVSFLASHALSAQERKI